MTGKLIFLLFSPLKKIKVVNVYTDLKKHRVSFIEQFLSISCLCFSLQAHCYICTAEHDTVQSLCATDRKACMLCALGFLHFRAARGGSEYVLN